jgi:SAM-dependent methyltransferase
MHLDEGDLQEVLLEAPTATGKRMDIEAGCAVIEVKKGMGSTKARLRALEQLAGYVQARTEERGQRYVGVLTDGKLWILVHLRPNGELAEVSRLKLESADGAVELSAWLEVVLATVDEVRPNEREIAGRLGADSPATQVDLADLREIYATSRSDSELALKRRLWAKLLTSALGTHFPDTDELFVLHTYLVVTAELIAHTVVGLPVQSEDPEILLSGKRFRSARLGGVVDADFFDWPAQSEPGRRFVSALARRIARFDWSSVEHDALKTLYQSIIDQRTRKQLGEYYTPDWLAEGIVDETISDPLRQRVLDPACGSGTFLFWAARKYLDAADAAGVPGSKAITGLIAHVAGVDLHPVAVCLARVTYLLAIGPDRLQGDRPPFSVPVYLGDSMRWDPDETLLGRGGITIPTGDEPHGNRDLHFPEKVVANANLFDQLVADLAERASVRERGTSRPKIDSILRRYKVSAPDRPAVVEAFEVLCSLHDEGRNHIWGYYVRNLARPYAFSRPNNQVDVVVGNPPWLAFRFMPKGMQERYAQLAKERGLWIGGKVATNQDLADLFVARCLEQYLARDGRFGFVMPGAALSRRAYEGFRSAQFDAPSASTKLSFDLPWDLRGVVPDIFPMPACVVFGRRAEVRAALPTTALSFAGKIGRGDRWGDAHERLIIRATEIQRGHDAGVRSPYAESFYQGATIVPSVLLRVRESEVGPLGAPTGMKRVVSRRSSLEKEPWKGLEDMEGLIESRFVRSVYLGSGIAPFRTLAEIEAVIPRWRRELFDGDCPKLDDHPGLAEWWREAEARWNENKGATNTLTLRERLDFQRGISNQFPISEHRVLYTQSGNKIAACRLDGSSALIEHKLYWAAVGSIDEARYLIAILNSGPLHNAVEPLMSEGLFGKRDIDKYVFAAPFPTFRKSDPGHIGLARLSKTAERVVAEVELRETWGFQKSRRVIREALREHGVATEIDAAVAELLAIGLSSIAVRKGDGQKTGFDLMGALSNAEKERVESGKTREKGRKKQLRPLQRRRRDSSLAGKSRGKQK